MPQEYTLTPMTKEENIYAYRQSQQISMQTGYYGYVRGDFDKSGALLSTTFEQFSGAPIREHFETEREAIIEYLEKGICSNLNNMDNYCKSHEDAAFNTPFGKDYGFRIDSGNLTCLLVLHPRNVADYAMHLYCYDKYLLLNHMSRAKRGISFIDSRYQPLFNLKDGDGIMIRYPDGDASIKACRFIDEYHTQVGNNIYHICEFAELMERNGNTIIPYRNSLPDKCYIYVDTQDVYAVVTKGKDGFEPVEQAKYPDKKRNWDYVNAKNKVLGISNEQVEAMTMASMMGWADKFADPRFYEPKNKDSVER